MIVTRIVTTRIILRVMCLAVVALPTGIVTVDEVDLEQLLSHVKRNVIDGENLFEGLGVTSKRTDIDDGKIQKTMEVRFDQLDNNVWRCETHASADPQTEIKFLMMRDSTFSFNASHSGVGDYQFGKLGFDSAVHGEVKKNWRSQFPYPHAVNDVLGVKLEKFFSMPELKATDLADLEPHAGHKVAGIQFDAPNFKGEIQWLPDDGYLLKRVQIFRKIPDQKNKSIQDVAIDYKVVNDRLMPFRVTRVFAEGRSTTSEISEFREANPDRDFYKAEAIGLDTPSRPWRPWQKWGLLAAICLALGLFFRARAKQQRP